MIQKIKVSSITVKRDLADLQAKGILTREGGRKEGRWVIIKKMTIGYSSAPHQTWLSLWDCCG